MKTKITKIYMLLVFSLLIIFSACSLEQDTIKNESNFKNNVKRARLLSGNDVNPIKEKLIQKINKISKLNITSQSSSTLRTSSEGEIDFNEIMEIIDSLGIKNYTFKINNHPLDDDKTFHNLILTEKGEEYKLTIIKYELTQEYADLIVKNPNDFINYLQKVSSSNISIIDDPCNEEVIINPINGGNTGGGSGGDGGLGGGEGGYGSGTGGSGGGGGGEECLEVSLSYVCGNCNANFRDWANYQGSVCGNGQYPLIVVITYTISDTCRTEINPCNPDGTIGVLEPKNNFEGFIDNLSQDQRNWLLDQDPQVENSIYQYLLENNFQLENKKIIKRWIDLQIALEDNPTLLIDIPCDQVPAWQNLTQFTPPQSVINKIETLDNQSFGDFNIQYISQAKGAAINLDYFPVTINQLPINPYTGSTFTPTQFLNHIRTSLNSFVDTSISEFSTSLVTGYDEPSLWYSNNPLTAVLHINISGPAGDGSVICSQYNNTSWTFTTIEVPWGFAQGEDGIHPVSGNREFGIVQNPNGSYTFFTRAADRMTDGFESIVAENTTILSNPFDNPDNLWNSLKNKVYNFVQNNGGNAIPPSNDQNKIWRPAWNKVRQYLRGEVSLSELGCN